MNEVEVILNEYYNNHDEESRLIKDKAHRIEYITTTKYIEKYMYDNDTFDITLVLGPLYHLYDEKDTKQAIKEAIRVTKKGGKIFIAYLTDDSVIFSYGVRKGNLKRLKELCDEKWNLSKIKEEIFATFKVNDFNKLISSYRVKALETIATDGIATNMAEYINTLTDEEFEIFIDYHLKNCNREDLICYSSHVLEIIEKL